MRDIDVELAVLVGHLRGDPVAERLKAYINRLLDAGIYADGYELAVQAGTLNRYEVDELVAVLIKHDPGLAEQARQAVRLIAGLEFCQQMSGFFFYCEGSICYSSGFAVYKIRDGRVLWDTKPIVFDGIELLGHGQGVIRGRSYDLGANDGRWATWTLDEATGQLVDSPGFEPLLRRRGERPKTPLRRWWNRLRRRLGWWICNGERGDRERR